MSYFKIPTAMHIIFKNSFLIKHDERFRAFFIEKFIYDPINKSKLQKNENIEDLFIDVDGSDYKLSFIHTCDFYKTHVDFKSTKYYKHFKNTIFATMFIKKNIKVFFKGELLYENGKIKLNYKNNANNLHNIAYFLTIENS